MRVRSLLTMVLAIAALAPASARPQAAPRRTPQLLETGRVAYGINCAHCHGERGHGDGAAAATLNPRPRDFTRDAFRHGARVSDVFRTITQGIRGTGMTGFAELGDDERWGLAYYVLELRGAATKPPP